MEFIIQPSNDGGFGAKAVGYSIFTQAHTLEELKCNIAEAIECHFDGPSFPDFSLTFADNL